MVAENANAPIAVIVLGAGASADCANSATIANPEYEPPLARGLFQVATKPRFQEILLRYNGARALAARLGDESRKSEFDLEARLRHYANHQSPMVRHHFVDIPLYLNDLFTEVSAKYTTTPSTHVAMLLDLLFDVPHRCLFVSLNYDRFLEQAIEVATSGRTVFDNLGDYVNRDFACWVVKPHGSVDWYIQSPTLKRFWDPDRPIKIWELPARPWQVHVRPKNGARGDGWYPALTAPIANKTLQDLSCCSEHRQFMDEHLPKATKAAFIGTSGLDGHVFAHFGKLMTAVKHIDVVGKGQTHEVRDRLMQVIPQIGKQRTRAFDEGFRNYTNSAEWKEFLQAT